MSFPRWHEARKQAEIYDQLLCLLESVVCSFLLIRRYSPLCHSRFIVVGAFIDVLDQPLGSHEPGHLVIGQPQI